MHFNVHVIHNFGEGSTYSFSPCSINHVYLFPVPFQVICLFRRADVRREENDMISGDERIISENEEEEDISDTDSESEWAATETTRV